jgi:hypothetical protein
LFFNNIKRLYLGVDRIPKKLRLIISKNGKGKGLALRRLTEGSLLEEFCTIDK